MAILFMDGFDNYNTGSQKWDTNAGTFGNTTPTPRFTTGKYLVITSGSTLVKSLPTNYTTLYAGAAFYLSSLASTTTILAFADGLGGTGNVQVDVRVNTNGSLTVTRAGTVLGTSSVGLVGINTWHHLGLKATINNTTGTYDVWLNGVNVLSGTGANTRNTANSYANAFLVVPVGGTVLYDDFYIGDTSGSSPQNDFVGDCRIDTQYPASAGNYTQWTPSTGSNWQNVDDTPPNGDTDYNSDATVGHIDSFVPTPIVPLSGTVYARQTNLYARKDDAAVRKIAPFFRHSTTDAVGADDVLPSSYAFNLQIFQTNPANSSAAWTVSDCNNDEIGYKTTA